eukprot:445385_1
MSTFHLLFILFSFVSAVIKECNIIDYGAKGDGKTDNTKFIQSAIDQCAQASSNVDNDTSMVVLPYISNNNGKETVYISGALFLKSNLAFYLDKNVRLLGLPAYSNINTSYPYIYTRREGTMVMTHSSLINGGICVNLTNYNTSTVGDQCSKWNKLKNVKIFGDGIIDGNGASGWYNTSNLHDTRPCLVNLMWINNLEIFNISLVNPPFWTLHPIFSNNIFISNISIINDSPNGDGIDPDSCSNMIISDSFITSGDDQIAIKSGKDIDGRAWAIPSNNISIINCVMGNGHGLSIGSEMSGNVTNILFENITISNKWVMKQGPHIKSNADRGGMVANVMFKNIVIENIAVTGISIDEYYGSSKGTFYPIFKNISLINVNITVQKDGSDGVFKCYKQQPCEDIILDNVDVKGGSSFQCKDAYGNATNTEPESCLIDINDEIETF